MKLHKHTNGWELYYDRALQLWVGIQYDADGYAIEQDNGEEAVYGYSKANLIEVIG